MIETKLGPRAWTAAAVVGISFLGLVGCSTAAKDRSAASPTSGPSSNAASPSGLSSNVASASGLAKAKAAGLDPSLYEKAAEEAKSLAGSAKLARTLDYIGGQSGTQAQDLEAVYQAFTDATGTKIDYTKSGSSVGTTAAIESRIAAGNPPDVVDLSLGQAKAFAKKGYTADLNKIVGGSVLTANYSPSLLTSLSNNGQVFGITQGFSNFMVWYNPKSYTGPLAPTSWQQVVDWTNTTAAKGTPPWCIAEEAGAGSGFPGTQFIEEIFAKTYGSQAVAAWSDGDLKWTSEEVKNAWKEFGSIALDNTKVAGGVTGSLSANMATGSNGLIADPPTCQADLWGSWVPGLIGSGVKPEVNLSFYQVPGVVPQYASTEIYNAGATVVLKSTPTTSAFIKFLASEPAQALIASANQWTVANKLVPTSTYTSSLLKKAAGIYFSNNVNLVAPPDIMASSAVDAAFNKGVIAYLSNPSSLDQVLATIQSAENAS